MRVLVAALQQKGEHVSVIRALRTRPPMIADGVRRQARPVGRDLADLEDRLARE